MPHHDDLTVPGQGWSDAIGPIEASAKVRVQNTGATAAILQAFPTDAPPTSAAEAEGGVTLWNRQGWHFTLQDDFPGVTGGTYLRAYGASMGTTLSISHA